jgi:lipopolysaccharide/colanic/teichoic acid biosynthesis glycosyltransferase
VTVGPMKRFFDIVVSLAAILLLSPLWIPVVIILRLTGERYVFYVQERIGKGGKPFGLLKFATMFRDSPKLGTGNITIPNDWRVLPFGRVLRKTKINELPQLINILKGDMSIIGPRPVTPDHYDYYAPEVQEIIGRMRPGLSGVGSIVFRDEEALLTASGTLPESFYGQYIAPYKGSLEVWYYSNKSFFLDLRLIALTVLAVAKPDLKPHKYLKGLPEAPAQADKPKNAAATGHLESSPIRCEFSDAD